MRLVLEVEGLAGVQRSLRQIGPAAAKGLRLALNEAADLLINKVTPQIPSRTGAARRSLKARSSQKAVRIAVGGKRAPYYPWLDFGGRTGRNRSVLRPFKAEGRYLYPGLRANRAEIEKLIERRLREVAEDAGLEVD